MTRRALFPLLAVLLTLGTASGQSADQIIERARIATTLQNTDLRGHIRKGWSKTDVSLFLRGKNIQFTTGKGTERFHMRLGAGQYDLFEIVNGKTQAFPKSKFGQKIAGSDLTYEDLSLRFFYWPNAKLEGGERVNTHDCWKIRLDNPGSSGDYRTVYAWIHKEFGAFMKIEGFDRSGKRLKRFEVERVMKLPDGSYTVREIKISDMDGERAKSHSYLEFEKPERVVPGAR